MPIYEYRCTACEHIFEEWQKISDPPVKKCPKCKKSKVERLVSAPAFHLKGGGWYKDLYASVNKKDGGSGSEPSKEGSESTPAKTESTPKSESKSDNAPSAAKSGGGKKKRAASA